MKYVLLGLLLSTNAFAGEKVEDGPYLALGANFTKIKAGDVKVSAWGTVLTAGYQFNPYVSVEVGLHEWRLDDQDEGFDYAGDAKGISLSILPTLPITDKLDGYLSLGYRYTTESITATDQDSGHQWNNTDSDTDFSFGAGLKYQVNDSVFIRGNVDTTFEAFDDFGDTTTVGFDVGINF